MTGPFPLFAASLPTEVEGAATFALLQNFRRIVVRYEIAKPNRFLRVFVATHTYFYRTGFSSRSWKS
jgi:hypothetical protein